MAVVTKLLLFAFDYDVVNVAKKWKKKKEFS